MSKHNAFTIRDLADKKILLLKFGGKYGSSVFNVECANWRKKCPKSLSTPLSGVGNIYDIYHCAIYCMVSGQTQLTQPQIDKCPNSNIPLSLSSSSRSRCSGCNCISSESDELFDRRYDFGMNFDFLYREEKKLFVN